MDPLFETKNARGGILAISSASEHPDKALEFINLLNTDEYVGTLILSLIHIFPDGVTAVGQQTAGVVHTHCGHIGN